MPAKRKAQAKKRPAGADREDPRFAAVIDALAAEPRFAAVINAYAASKKEGGRKFGSNGLKVNGKLFAMVEFFVRKRTPGRREKIQRRRRSSRRLSRQQHQK